MSDHSEPILPMPPIPEEFIRWINECAEQAAWASYGQAQLFGSARLRMQYPPYRLVTVEPV